MWARNRWFFILVDIFCLLNFCLFSRRPSALQRHDNMITFSLNRVFVFWNFLWHFFIKVADLIVRLMKRSFVWARTDKNRRKFHVNIYKACRYYYKNNLRSVKLLYPLKLFYSTCFLEIFVFFSFSSKLMFGAKSRKHLSWTLCFYKFILQVVYDCLMLCSW